VEKLPEILVSRFAVAARDVLWFKPKVLGVFDRAGVPRSIMAELRQNKSEPTIKLSHRTVELLEQMGEPGLKVLQTLIREVAEWDDLSHLEPAKRTIAKASQAALKSAVKDYANRRRYLRDREKENQREREAKGQISQLDHARLQSFRDRFDTAFIMKNAQLRGNALEDLINDIFDYYCPKNRGPFRRVGEQVDGNFVFGEHHYFCEIRWRQEKASAADVSVLRDRAAAAFGGDVRALFVSFEGFSSECLEKLNRRGAAERVILMDGVDLRAVLNADIAFDILLDEKLALAVREGRAFVSARELVLARVEGSTHGPAVTGRR
jgi:hypothetical protein